MQRNLQFNNLSDLRAGSFLVNETMDAFESGIIERIRVTELILNDPQASCNSDPFRLDIFPFMDLLRQLVPHKSSVSNIVLHVFLLECKG